MKRSPMQQVNRNREYGRIEKLAQREILKVEKEYARDRDSLRERDTKVIFFSNKRKIIMIILIINKINSKYKFLNRCSQQ